MNKIKLHSVTDLITNSSTTIFTYSDNSIEPLKEMINEILKTFNIDQTCDDMFDIIVLCSNEYDYEYWLESNEMPDGIDSDTDIKNLYNDVITGKIPKPKWFEEVEEHEDYDGFLPSTYISLIPKEEKYNKIGNLIFKFLYSTDHEATRDG